MLRHPHPTYTNIHPVAGLRTASGSQPVSEQRLAVQLHCGSQAGVVAKAGAYVMLYSRQVARNASEDHIK